MASKAHTELRKLTFSKRSSTTSDPRYRAEYDLDNDISTGYYRDNPVITIYWKKDLVVLSDCKWSSRTTKALLNVLLPSLFTLYQTKGIWILSYGTSNHYVWTGSQTFSLSKYYNIYALPWAKLTIKPGQVDVTITEPLKVIVVERHGSFYCVVEATAVPVPTLRGYSYYNNICTLRRTCLSRHETKKEAIDAALVEATHRHLPFVEEKLSRRIFLRYMLNPHV